MISLSGFIGSGKGEVSRILQKDFGYTPISFAEPLKDVVSIVFSWDRNLLEGDTIESRDFREKTDEYWSRKLGYPVTPRKMLQFIGTELFQNNFMKNIWILSLEKRYYNDINNGKVIFSDTRFKHEMDYVKKRNYKIVYVERETPSWVTDVQDWYSGHISEMPDLCKNMHKSEYEWLSQKPDYIIENKKSLDDLKNNVHSMVKTLDLPLHI